MWNDQDAMALAVYAKYHYTVDISPPKPEIFKLRNNPPANSQFFGVCFNLHFQCRTKHPIFCSSSDYVSCQEFFQFGPSLLRYHLFHRLLPPESLEILTYAIMDEATRRFAEIPPCRFDDPNCSVVYPMTIDIVVETPEEAANETAESEDDMPVVIDADEEECHVSPALSLSLASGSANN